MAKQWLSERNAKLIISDDAGFFYKITYVELDDNERTSERIGNFTAIFHTLDGLQYSVDGAMEYDIEDVCWNPYIECHPTYKITAEGMCTLKINGKTMTANVGQNLTIDTDRMIAYREDGTLNNTELYADVKGLVEVSLGDTVHCRNNNLDIVTDARVTELEWDCVNDRILSVSLGDYQFDYISNQVSINNRIESAIREDGSVIGSQVQGILDAVKTQFHALRDVAQKQDVRAMLFEDLNPDSPTFGAMCLGSMGFEIASKRTADGKDWIWSTFGTGKGFFADYIIAGTMLADRIYGGTLTIGGIDNIAGIIKVLDGNGAILTIMDKDGILTNGKYTCGSDEFGRRVEISEGEMKIMDKSGNTVGRIFAVSNEIFKIGTENALFRMFKTGEVYVDCQSFGVNGYNGFTGTVEYSDGTYENYVGGLLIGGKSKEGAYP